MAKPRTCPHCLTVIPSDHGFNYDVDLNLVCENCGKVVFATTEVAENPLYRPYGGAEISTVTTPEE